MARVHGLEHVKGFFAADLAEDDAIGAHTEAVDEQLTLTNGSLALDVWRTRFEADQVFQRDIQFGRIFDGDHALGLRNISRQYVEHRGLAGAGASGDQNAESRTRGGLEGKHHFSRDALQFNQLLRGDRPRSEAADRHGGTVERQRRDDCIDAGSVGQTSVDHGRGLIHSAAHPRYDAVDDLQQVTIVAELGVDPHKLAALFDEHIVFAVDQDVRDLWIAQERLQRPKTEDFIKQVGLNLFLLIKAQRHGLIADDVSNQSSHNFARLLWIDARQFFQIQLGDQGPMDFRFVFFEI